MKKVAALWFFLNVADAVCTWYGVSHHYCYEGNPLMAVAIEHSYAAFFAVKLTLGAIATWLMVRINSDGNKVAKWFTWAFVVIYGVLMLDHAFAYYQMRMDDADYQSHAQPRAVQVH